MERFSNKTAIAPTASISTICGGASPGIEPIAGNSYVHKTLSGSFNVRNIELEKLLERKGQNSDEIWSSITVHEGSVQHLDFLDEHEKAVFKTAFEIDQRWVIELAADRAPLVTQGQSVNVFLPADVHKRDLHQIHFQAWKKGLKSLYYCRSKSIQRAEVVADLGGQAKRKSSGKSIRGGEQGDAVRDVPPAEEMPLPLSAAAAEAAETEDENKYEECLSCE